MLAQSGNIVQQIHIRLKREECVKKAETYCWQANSAPEGGVFSEGIRTKSWIMFNSRCRRRSTYEHISSKRELFLVTLFNFDLETLPT